MKLQLRKSKRRGSSAASDCMNKQSVTRNRNPLIPVSRSELRIPEKPVRLARGPPPASCLARSPALLTSVNTPSPFGIVSALSLASTVRFFESMRSPLLTVSRGDLLVPLGGWCCGRLALAPVVCWRGACIVGLARLWSRLVVWCGRVLGAALLYAALDLVVCGACLGWTPLWWWAHVA